MPLVELAPPFTSLSCGIFLNKEGRRIGRSNVAKKIYIYISGVVEQLQRFPSSVSSIGLIVIMIVNLVGTQACVYIYPIYVYMYVSM